MCPEFGWYRKPWEPSGWSKPPVTPDELDDIENHEQALRDAEDESFGERLRQHERRCAADIAATRLEQACGLIDTLCEIAAGHAASGHTTSMQGLETAATELIPKIIRNYDHDPDGPDLGFDRFQELLLQVSLEAARKGFEVGHRAAASRNRTPRTRTSDRPPHEAPTPATMPPMPGQYRSPPR